MTVASPLKKKVRSNAMESCASTKALQDFHFIHPASLFIHRADKIAKEIYSPF